MRKPKNIVVLAVILVLFGGGPFLLPMESPPHVQLPAEPIAGEGGFMTLTNTMTAAWASIIVLVALFYFATRNLREVPGRLQCLVEFVLEFILDLCSSVAGKERGRKFFTLCATLFLFILVSNWMGLLPGYGTIGVWHELKTEAKTEAIQGGDAHAVAVKQDEHGASIKEGEDAATTEAAGHESHRVLYAFLRSASTDLNTTIGLALISVIATQIYGFRALGFLGYSSRFINLRGPIDLIVGLLESISEVAKIVSLSFRLFGNIFAGEVLLGVMAFLVPWVASVPFMGLELFVGLMQAFVFMMLTLVFLSTATTEHGAEHKAEHAGSH